jgi:MFS family permease
VGTLGAWMQATAQGWLVLELTNSPALLGVTSAVANSPTLVLSVFAGVLADRIDRRRLLVATQLAAAALAASLALLTMTRVVEFWHVLVIAGLSGSVGALAMPAFQAIVSTIVDRRAIGNAVALNSAQFNLGRIVGPTAAGAAIAAGGLAVAFWANSVALLVVALVLGTLRLPSSAALVRAEASMWANLIDGIVYLRRDRVIRLLVVLAAVPALFVLNYLVLMPVYARDILGVGAPGLGLLTAGVGIGALSGALGVAVLRPSGGSGNLMLAGLTLSSSALIVFAVSRWLPLSLAALAVLGAAQVAYYTTTSTLIQMLVPPRLRGRVSSLYVLASLGVIPFGNLLAGFVAERFDPTVALAGGGLATLVAVALVVVAFPELRRVEARSIPPSPDPATLPG